MPTVTGYPTWPSPCTRSASGPLPVRASTPSGVNGPMENVPEGFPPPKGDYRYVGPVTECPICQGVWFHTLMAMDPETQLPGAWLCDAMCIDCYVIVMLATPADDIPREAVNTDALDAD